LQFPAALAANHAAVQPAIGALLRHKAARFPKIGAADGYTKAGNSIEEQHTDSDAGMKVLVVDDETPIVDAVAYNLRKEGYEALSAGDAEHALEIVRRDRPDLVILDVMLPSASGFDICRTLRPTSDIPIIMLTASAEE